jgi:hypothetical protein
VAVEPGSGTIHLGDVRITNIAPDLCGSTPG